MKQSPPSSYKALATFNPRPTDIQLVLLRTCRDCGGHGFGTFSAWFWHALSMALARCGHGSTMPAASQNQAQMVPETRQEHARTMPRACQNHARSVPEPCQDHASSMPEPWPEHAGTTPAACQNHHAQSMPEPCPSCQKYACRTPDRNILNTMMACSGHVSVMCWACFWHALSISGMVWTLLLQSLGLALACCGCGSGTLLACPGVVLACPAHGPRPHFGDTCVSCGNIQSP